MGSPSEGWIVLGTGNSAHSITNLTTIANACFRVAPDLHLRNGVSTEEP